MKWILCVHTRIGLEYIQKGCLGKALLVEFDPKNNRVDSTNCNSQFYPPVTSNGKIFKPIFSRNGTWKLDILDMYTILG